jgi:hypothetical protein
MTIRYSEKKDVPPTESGFTSEGEIKPSIEQLMILCIDASLSMRNAQDDDDEFSRSHEVFAALFKKDGLFSTLETSSNRLSFWTMGIAFNQSAELIWKAQKFIDPVNGGVLLFGDTLEDMPELKTWKKGTSISAALFKAKAAAEKWLLEKRNRRFVTIAVISDGADNDDENPCLLLAESIKASAEQVTFGTSGIQRPRIVIACAAYGQRDDEESNWELLEKIATHPTEFYKEVPTGEELRDFLIASITIKA